MFLRSEGGTHSVCEYNRLPDGGTVPGTDMIGFGHLLWERPILAVGRAILCKEPADGLGNRPYPPITGAGATAQGALRGPLAVRTHESVQI